MPVVSVEGAGALLWATANSMLRRKTLNSMVRPMRVWCRCLNIFFSIVFTGYLYLIMGNIDTAGRQPILTILGLTRVPVSAYYTVGCLSTVADAAEKDRFVK